MMLLVALSEYFLWWKFNKYFIYPKGTCSRFPICRIDDKLCLRSVTCKTSLQFWSVTKWFLPAGKINDKSWEKRLSCRSVIIYWQSWHLQVFLLPSAFYNVTLENLWWCKLNKFSNINMSKMSCGGWIIVDQNGSDQNANMVVPIWSPNLIVSYLDIYLP